MGGLEKGKGQFAFQADGDKKRRLRRMPREPRRVMAGRERDPIPLTGASLHSQDIMAEQLSLITPKDRISPPPAFCLQNLPPVIFNH